MANRTSVASMDASVRKVGVAYSFSVAAKGITVALQAPRPPAASAEIPANLFIRKVETVLIIVSLDLIEKYYGTKLRQNVSLVG